MRAAIVALAMAPALAAPPANCVSPRPDCAPGAPCAVVVCPAGGDGAGVEWIEWATDRYVCQRTHGGRELQRADGSRVWLWPVNWYEPHPGDGCWRPGETTRVRSRVCRGGDCAPWSAWAEIEPLEWRCARGNQWVACELGAAP